MKTIFKVIIIMLFALLIGQLIYYNFKNDDESNANSENNNQVITVDEREKQNRNENITTYNIIEIPENIVMPDNFYVVERYNNNESISSEELREKLEKFVKEDVKTINTITTMKSINYKLQYYDEHTEEINNMGIYSAEDFSEIAKQINLLDNNDNYESSEIDTSSYEQTEDGYTKFKVILTYESKRTIELYINLANNETTQPNIKFTSGE